MGQDHISIAVIPLRNTAKQDDFDYFVTGFTEDLIGELTRFQAFRVVASQSITALIGSGRMVEEVAREWGLDYLIHGSVRRDVSAIRVSVQLVQADSSHVVWARRFDFPLEEVFAVQDEIIATIASTLSVQIDESHLNRAKQRTGDDLAAYDYYLRGMECLRRGTLDGDEESRPLFEAALETEPRFSRAYAGLSLSYFNEWSCQAWHLFNENEKNAFVYAAKAVELDDTDAMVHAVLARVHRYRHEHDRADHHAARALSLNPNDANVLIQIALAKLFGGEFVEAAELARKAIRSNPLHGGWYQGIVGWSLFMDRSYAEAYPLLQAAGDYVVNFGAYRAACCAMANDAEGAQRAYDHFQRVYCWRIAFGREPDLGEAIRWAIQVEPFRNRDDAGHMPGILRRTGLIDFDVRKAVTTREPQAARPADTAQSPGNRFVNDGAIWTLAYEGKGAQLVELKGFHDIAQLLKCPGESIHSLELSGGMRTEISEQEVIDDQARIEYRNRIFELQALLDKTDGGADSVRRKALEQELQVLTEELAKATGLRGRTRLMSSSGERARTAVTWRIRSAIRKIQVAHPRLGQHLANSIRTGTFCAYVPEVATDWEV
ncbi:MAG: hypothetical protein K1Y02_19500 [Candidatus Hydrogenedentes bacterium]|nr:hypothetical protein [Candidatus Hydrogenedentota bacterium]